VLGEDLVAFRDTQGRVGLIEPHCAHRGAHLFFGRNEDCGIRCIYHGWKYDVDGKCVDMPNVPPGSGYHGKIAIKAYPTKEFGNPCGRTWGRAAACPKACLSWSSAFCRRRTAT
jgi:phthalate 4,5-dioxygenase